MCVRERKRDLDLDLFIDSLQYTHGKPWGKEKEDPGNIPGWASKRGHFLENSLAPTNKL